VPRTTPPVVSGSALLAVPRMSLPVVPGSSPPAAAGSPLLVVLGGLPATRELPDFSQSAVARSSVIRVLAVSRHSVVAGSLPVPVVLAGSRLRAELQGPRSRVGLRVPQIQAVLAGSWLLAGHRPAARSSVRQFRLLAGESSKIQVLVAPLVRILAVTLARPLLVPVERTSKQPPEPAAQPASMTRRMRAL